MPARSAASGNDQQARQVVRRCHVTTVQLQHDHAMLSSQDSIAYDALLEHRQDDAARILGTKPRTNQARSSFADVRRRWLQQRRHPDQPRRQHSLEKLVQWMHGSHDEIIPGRLMFVTASGRRTSRGDARATILGIALSASGQSGQPAVLTEGVVHVETQNADPAGHWRTSLRMRRRDMLNDPDEQRPRRTLPRACCALSASHCRATRSSSANFIGKLGMLIQIDHRRRRATHGDQ